jgi:hypothetical protein
MIRVFSLDIRTPASKVVTARRLDARKILLMEMILRISNDILRLFAKNF